MLRIIFKILFKIVMLLKATKNLQQNQIFLYKNVWIMILEKKDKFYKMKQTI